MSQEIFEYIDQPEHTFTKGLFTVLTAEHLSKLPKDLSHDGPPFEVELLDATTGKTHRVRMWFASYDIDPDGGGMLNTYSWFWHYCPCHREGDVAEDIEPSKDCEYGRWFINSVYHPALPGINLYREERLTGSNAGEPQEKRA